MDRKWELAFMSVDWKPRECQKLLKLHWSNNYKEDIMRKLNHFTMYLICASFGWINISYAQDTFSIVAVDTVTGEVGSAGASFVASVPKALLDDAFSIHPGVGAIHTQARYNANNQQLANELMIAGFSPQVILDFVLPGDAYGDQTIRQYLIIDVVDGGRCAAFTGESCMEYANHIVGKNYVIAGNILTGPQVLENMQANFLNTSGPLGHKLMSALQGGREAGGDKRGEANGLSSLVAALKVAKPENSKDSLYLDLFVAYGGDFTELQDPVDSLQILYNDWYGGPTTRVVTQTGHNPVNYCLYNNYPNPFNPTTQIMYDVPKQSLITIDIYNALGQHVKSLVDLEQMPGQYNIMWDGTNEFNRQLGAGIYLCRLKGTGSTKTIKLIMVK
jgi:uncharacterized Ntn-hydrolase superfamily protein